MKNLVTTLFLWLMALAVYGQDAIISGTITDEKSGEPLPGATIQVQNTTLGAVMDVHGEFSLRIKGSESTQIVVPIPAFPHPPCFPTGFL